LSTTVALDAATVMPGSPAGWREASRFTLGVGIAGSLGAALTGVTDRQHTHEQSRRIGLVHGVSNVGATGLYVLSWWDRGRGRHRRGMLASTLGYGIPIGSGYLGAALVYGAGAGVDHSGARLGTRQWTAVLPSAELADGSSQRVEVDGAAIEVMKHGKDTFTKLLADETGAPPSVVEDLQWMGALASLTYCAGAVDDVIWSETHGSTSIPVHRSAGTRTRASAGRWDARASKASAK
jgi:uncharacterized membrane protein